jgi:ATP-binding cassette, subfamily B, bacterial HlyB/CyaB
VGDQVVLFEPNQVEHSVLTVAQFANRVNGQGWLFSPVLAPPLEHGSRIGDESSHSGISVARRFGFSWFVPELLRHKKVWRDVLLASLALQMVMLVTPLLTQVIIDKVVVHRTQSTLITVGIALAICIVLSTLLGWARQYLVIHTGNRVDAVLGATVWEYLLKLPTSYFERRPTGVVAARLHAVENIREFISGASISLILDLPFLVICVAIMFWYSALLTSAALSILVVIAIVSLLMAPVFQKSLNEQFLLGAKNQAFITEYISGFETVKTLQMEPQLRDKYSNFLANFLLSSFRTKQVSNSYNSFASAMEQLLTLFILIVGANLVMSPNVGVPFTIGMLIAFQMFAGKLSQPVMRIVGLWTQFQQAKLAVDRLGDVLNSPIEPYRLTPNRSPAGSGDLSITGLGFRYAADRPYLYDNFNLQVAPGSAIAIAGPSGCGKSTLTKLLLGFYQPTHGAIKIDGVDIRHLSANELREYFGVVPQETILFSGSILENLRAGNFSASLEQCVEASKMAGIHAVIEKLPHGYESQIGERGVGLSGGQKQRIAIARALLKNPKILIFDEATSALDQETAEAFALTVNEFKGRVTVLFIAHSLPKNLLIDRVLNIGSPVDNAAILTRVKPDQVGGA